MRIKALIGIIVIAVLIITGIMLMKGNDGDRTQVRFTTNYGVFEISLFDKSAPKTVENFVELTEKSFYDGTRFHRVIDGFMIQGGDPNSKNVEAKNDWGKGDPGYKFEDEIHAENFNKAGTIAMANSGPNTNGSQFFINVADNEWLNDKHTVFGEVVKGMDVVMEISKVETELKGLADRPVEDVLLEKVEVLE